MQIINWKVTKKDAQLIGKIVQRAMTFNPPEYDAMTCSMDITACHANGCEIDLQGLLDADNFNFSHDVFGIARHINRDTGKLTMCFVPRCAVGEGQDRQNYTDTQDRENYQA